MIFINVLGSVDRNRRVQRVGGALPSNEWLHEENQTRGIRKIQVLDYVTYSTEIQREP